MSSEIAEKQEFKVIIFQLKDEEYAIEVDYVESIEKMMPVTRIPRALPFVTGVMNLRGIITPIINLRKRFEIEDKEFDDDTRILLISKGDLEIGFIVDSANDVIDIRLDEIEPTPEVIGGVESNYLRGVVKKDNRLFTILDVEKVILES